MSDIISIGSACVVRYTIDRFSKSKETNFFDWLITNFKTVLVILKDIDNRWFMSKDKFVQNGLWGPNDYIVDNTDISMRAVHDISINGDYDHHLNNFIEKYNRRLDRLKQYINGNKKLHMIHCLGYQYDDEYVEITQEDVSNFHEYIRRTNPNKKCFLHIVVPPKFNTKNLNHLKSNKTFVYYLNYNDKKSSQWWTNENYNWNIIFDNIKRIDSFKPQTINRNNTNVNIKRQFNASSVNIKKRFDQNFNRNLVNRNNVNIVNNVNRRPTGHNLKNSKFANFVYT